MTQYFSQSLSPAAMLWLCMVGRSTPTLHKATFSLW